MPQRCEHLIAHGNSIGFGLWPGTLFSALTTALWIALFIGLAWALLRWIIPHMLPTTADTFGTEAAGPSALERLIKRYAAGEIDAVTFEQMRERLEAAYQDGEQPYPPL
ncbi:MAG TPA: SHOCT domain-containing protein [Ktedonobacteraceae bacterium]